MLGEGNNLQSLLTGGVAAALILVALFFVIPLVRRWWGDWRIRRLVARLGSARIDNAVMPDGLGGSVFIEHLLLTPEGVLLVGVKPYRGTIFAAEHIDYWTQVIGRRSFKFANPLVQLEADAQAIRGLFPQLPLEARVVFSKDSEFPKGKPDAVLSFEQLSALAKTGEAGTIPTPLQNQWQQLLDQTQPASKHERRLIQQRVSLRPLVFAGGLLVLTVLWLMWRLQWPVGIWS